MSFKYHVNDINTISIKIFCEFRKDIKYRHLFYFSYDIPVIKLCKGEYPATAWWSVESRRDHEVHNLEQSFPQHLNLYISSPIQTGVCDGGK